MTHRSGRIAGWVGAPCGVLAAIFAIGAAAGGDAHPGPRVIISVVAVALAFVCIRVCTGGLVVRPDALVARGVFWSQRVPIRDVAGIAIQPVARRRAAALAVVTHDGAVVPAVLASWRVRTHRLQNGVTRAARDVARVSPSCDVAAVLGTAERLDHPAAFTVAVDGGDLVAVPAASPDPGLTPRTVRPSGGERLLGWETVFVVVAFVVPAAVSAVVVLVRDVAHVRALDEFELPLPHNPAGSLVLMLLLYGSSAVIVPIALLLLTRTGVPPRELGLTPRWLRLDLLPSVGLLGGVWLANVVVALALSPVLSRTLTSTRSDTHVPAYFVVYALFLSAVTAVNEEVVVNGYLMTRLAQRGWPPWPSLWLSLALRTSYHAYYGFALLLTVPFGYLVTRSFQRTRRLGRPIITHFLYDAILLTVAVLTS